MEHIIPHFLAYPCQSTKFIYFYLFKAAADLIKKKEHLSLEGYIKLLSFKAAFLKKEWKHLFLNRSYFHLSRYRGYFSTGSY